MMPEFESSISIPHDAPYFEGHFPGYPLVPGAVLFGLMLEEWQKYTGSVNQPVTAVNVKYLSEVRPGSQLRCRIRREATYWSLELYGMGGNIVAKARLQILEL